MQSISYPGTAFNPDTVYDEHLDELNHRQLAADCVSTCEEYPECECGAYDRDLEHRPDWDEDVEYPPDRDDQ